jgi:hypothetical protein
VGGNSSVGIATSYRWTVRGPNPSGGEIFRIYPDRPWGPPSLPYNGYRVSFPGLKLPGRGVNHPPPSSAEVKVRVELYLYPPVGLHFTVYLLPCKWGQHIPPVCVFVSTNQHGATPQNSLSTVKASNFRPNSFANLVGISCYMWRVHFVSAACNGLAANGETLGPGTVVSFVTFSLTPAVRWTRKGKYKCFK